MSHGGNLEYEGNEKPWEVSDKRLTSSDLIFKRILPTIANRLWERADDTGDQLEGSCRGAEGSSDLGHCDGGAENGF